MKIFFMIWSNFYFQCLFKIVLIIILAGIIGMERSSWNKSAGFRTHTLLGISAVLVVICGEMLAQRYSIDPFRIAAQFLSGMGFIGAGAILRDGVNIKGLTTASGLLTVSCIGLCVGAGFYLIAIIATFLTYLILSYSYIFTDKLDHFDLLELEINSKDEISDLMINLDNFFEKYELEVKQIKDISDENKEYDTIKVVLRYNNKRLSKNIIITEIASIKKIISVDEK